MKTYKVLAPMGFTIHTGRVKLSDDQARRRKHAIEAVKDAPGVYAVRSELSFKCKETFGYDGEISKAMAAELIDTATGKTVAETLRDDETKKRKSADADKGEAKKK